MSTRPSSAPTKLAARPRPRTPVMPAPALLPLLAPTSMAFGAEEHEAVLALTNTLFARLDLAGRVVSCSGAWEECLHLSRQELVGHTLLELVAPADRDACREALQRTLAGHPPEELPVRFNANGRGVIWLALRPSINARREALYLVARDITAEKLIADEPPPAEFVLDELEEGVLIADATRPGLPVLFANAGFTRMTGYTPAEARNRPLTFTAGPVTDTVAFQDAIAAAFRGERTTLEVGLRRKDGSPAWVRLHLRPSHDASGRVRHLIAVHLDTSERRLVLDALQDKNAALTEALESLQKTKDIIVQRERMHALGKMCSGIVHDFNNLLAPILGFTELMLTIPDLLRDPEKVALYLQKIRTAATDGATVVDRLREFYRSRADADPASEFSLQSVTQEVIDLTSHHWCNTAQAAGVTIKIETDFDATNPVFGSAAEVRQVLTNLVLNAVDAMPRGGTIRLRTYAVGNWVCAQITDTGAGMSEEVRRRCFEPFFTTKGRAGTGLGLAIVFGIIERHHGRVELETAEGRGTTFTLWLPSSRAPDAGEGGAVPVPVSGGRPLRILVVDDEDLLLEVLSQQLLNMGHVVECFTDPHQAIERFYRQPFDLVFTDRAMPGMNGDHFAKLVHEYRADTPVFLLTGFGSIIKETGEALENIAELLPKPLSHEKLRQVIARYGGRCTLGAAGA